MDFRFQVLQDRHIKGLDTGDTVIFTSIKCLLTQLSYYHKTKLYSANKWQEITYLPLSNRALDIDGFMMFLTCKCSVNFTFFFSRNLPFRHCFKNGFDHTLQVGYIDRNCYQLIDCYFFITVNILWSLHMPMLVNRYQ